ncbi:4-hydroxythreonine-4-phosphate dehydrogenase [Nitrosomonas sp. Nm51]|uniref:4-hydroxythreonine-4-phosphate dehydrogenase PdxA n=1 Tax=Nitrosomonas sp. Nm51 TaxID=133720 RepID=UPI0008B8BAA5|nr:4-hydroxythreonine-4-phosphate dehydrogenase PdxA [Nitrosomonas sp. Nm51]SER76615.1 4-hydroxythreonine-4-phosphate dehydrogenase [Nitrosomonas sp. Nm51]
MISETLPVIALTAGEPAGIGPDICLQMAQYPLSCGLVIIADRKLLKTRAQHLDMPVKLTDATNVRPGPHRTGSLQVSHRPVREPVQHGMLNPANAAYVLDTLQHAVTGCSRGLYDAMVTAPVHKGVINDAGIAFTGHTEYLAEITCSQTVMMLIGGGMRISLATTHLPLKDVPAAITRQNLENKLRIIQHDLINRFGISRPRIAVAGLNPHAGESGYLGTEEIDTIIPALDALRQAGFQLSGPLPADTLFNPAQLANYDCIFAMYHDQGLPVLKHASFGAGVNVTLGLPIIRTSVDHGTALDLAGTGKADAGSLFTAIELAIELSKNTKTTSDAQGTADTEGTKSRQTP